ncbi:MAG: T9SS type A sorting domain-containing protein [Bacteroidetes bacterium]|nr:T9SS type A sorting domain-containing protein [Bacteroidota bacterium]
MKQLSLKLFFLFALTVFIFGSANNGMAQCTYTVPYSGNNSIVANSGTICDHGGVGNYLDNANGYTVINPVSGFTRLTFTAFQTESGWDYVTVFDGVGVGGTQLFNGSGAALPPVLTSTTGALTLRFTSDGSITGAGFSATISNFVVTPPSISGFTPSSGCAGGTSVVITGANFTGAIGVSFGGTPAQSFVVNNNNQITAIPGAGATGVITVTTPSGSGSSVGTFTVNPSPAAPNPVTANPGSICAGSSTDLNAISVGNTINWYTTPSGGVALTNTPSGVNYSVSPAVSTIYYAESVAPGGGAPITFNFTGAAQTYTVPAGVTSINIETWGAQGANAAVGGTGGLGGYAAGTLAVVPGQILNIYVGGQNGYNGGGVGGLNGNSVGGGPSLGNAPNGGGATDIRVGGVGLGNRVIVAGGGGGAGYNGVWPGCQVAGPAGNGGAGGNAVAGDGTFGVGTPCNCGGGGGAGGTGGTQITGGIAGGYAGNNACLRPNYTIGTNGVLGIGGNGALTYYNGTGGGGGGGGGYYGGGSGGSGSDTTPGGGGGGGSSNTDGVTSPVTIAGVRNGNGQVIITPIGSGCVSNTRTSVTVSVSPVAALPVSVTATPSTLCSGGVSQLNSTAVANSIQTWYTVPSGGVAIGTSLSGVDFPVSPLVTTTYYVETASNIPGGSQTFSYTGSMQTFTVPAGITSVNIDAFGAQGGGSEACAPPNQEDGGLGGFASGTLSVIPGQVLNIFVGQKPTMVPGIGQPGGYNGGGASGQYGGAGGGASDVRVGGTALGDRVIVAGGGGGGNTGCPEHGAGGNGGGLSGDDGSNGGGGFIPGGGGSQIAGGIAGSAPGAPGSLGVGGGSGQYHEGGGGGGYYGGGSAYAAGGGGGSSYIGGVTGGITTPGLQTGNGQVVITWLGSVTCPSTPRVPVTVTVGTTPTITASASVNPVCSGTTTILTGGGAGIGGSYVWSGGVTDGVAFTPLATTTYTVTGSNASGCTSTSTITVTVNVTPVPSPVTATPATLCLGETSDLNAIAVGNDINWYTVPSGGVAIGTVPSGVNFPVTPAITTTYYAENAGPGGPGGSQTFNYTGSIQTFTVPAGVTSITMEARGAQGGSINVNCVASGGLGARMIGDVAVTPGEVISVLVGQQGFTNGADAGGGGGSFVVRTGNIPLVVAGGGGGASNNIGNCGVNLAGGPGLTTLDGGASGSGMVAGGINGNGGGANFGSGGGGGGFFTDGIAGSGLANNNGKSYLNGGIGGTGNNNDFGGYGGGGAGWFTGGNGGGGGGYSGGGTDGNYPTVQFAGGGGGGSYNIGANQSNTAGFQSGNGLVIFTWSGAPSCPSVRVPVTVTVNPTPVINATATPSTTCNLTSVNPCATGAVSYVWTGGLSNCTPFVATTTDTYTVTGTDGAGCTGTSSVTVTVTPASGVLAPTTSNQSQDHGDDFNINYYAANCDLIATVDDGAGGNVLGLTTSTVNVDATASFHNGQPFVRRWYQITPTTNGSADVKLYINQTDFDDYNAAVVAPYLPLPTGPGDAAGIANIRITKNDDGGLGNNPIVITPAVSWNGTYWELSFNTPSFSQFRVHSVNPGNVPLPVTVTSFSGTKLESSDKLSWITSSEQNNAYFNLQHSTDGISFSTIAKVASKAPNGNSNTALSYTATNNKPALGHNYYRLQQVDIDNKVSVHAQIVDLIWGANGSTVSIYPNPTTDILNIDLYATAAQNTTVKLLDMSGRVIRQVQAKSAVGMNNIQLSLGEIASGVYTVQVYENNHLSHTSKVKKDN